MINCYVRAIENQANERGFLFEQVRVSAQADFSLKTLQVREESSRINFFWRIHPHVGFVKVETLQFTAQRQVGQFYIIKALKFKLFQLRAKHLQDGCHVITTDQVKSNP